MRSEPIEGKPNEFRIIFETEEEKAQHEEYLKLFCDCPEENGPVDEDDEDKMPQYVEGHMGVDHGWICTTCNKFVQIG